LRIAIDATSLLLPSAGVRTYTHYWISSLLEAATGRGDQIVTYAPGVRVPEVLDHRQSAAGFWATQLGLRTVQVVNSTRLRGNPVLNLLLSRADLFHCSQHTVSSPRHKKMTATLFDLSCWTTPEHHRPDNIAATRRYGENILKVADGLIAISENTRQDAMKILGIPGERIRVIYPGVPEAYFEVGPEAAERARAKFGLSAPYLLFVGCIEPRKNVGAILEAYGRLSLPMRREVRLVLAGMFGWDCEEVQRVLSRQNGTVVHLGYVPEADLPGLMRGSAAVVYPSFYEGFGLPVAQAMAVGAPVITSDRSCLPEVVGDAGLYIDPNSVDELSAAMQRILASPELAQRLIARGRVRAQTFRWAASAERSMDFFHAC
jgi:alpha-1,3-rhamnosyl/mannosyltransferase